MDLFAAIAAELRAAVDILVSIGSTKTAYFVVFVGLQRVDEGF